MCRRRGLYEVQALVQGAHCAQQRGHEHLQHRGKKQQRQGQTACKRTAGLCQVAGVPEQKQGFTEIREIGRKSDKLFEGEAQDASGPKVERYVDARSGEVLETEFKGKRK